MDNVDAEIAEFHRAARRRKAVIFGVAAAVMIAVGLAALALGLLAPGLDRGVIIYDLRVIVVGAAVLIAGIGSAIKAFRVGTGRVLDVD